MKLFRKKYSGETYTEKIIYITKTESLFVSGFSGRTTSDITRNYNVTTFWGVDVHGIDKKNQKHPIYEIDRLSSEKEAREIFNFFVANNGEFSTKYLFEKKIIKVK